MIISLNLSGNKIGYERISYFGCSLKYNTSLKELDSKLNNLDD